MSHKTEQVGEIDRFGIRDWVEQINEKFRIIQRLFDYILLGEYEEDDVTYGSFYTSGANQTISVAAANTKYQVDGGFTEGQTKNTTFIENCGLQIQESGKYLINWSLTLNTAAANDDIRAGLMIGVVPLTPGNAKTSIQANSEDATIGSAAILDLNVDDELFFYVENLTNTNNIIVNNGSMTILKL